MNQMSFVKVKGHFLILWRPYNVKEKDRKLECDTKIVCAIKICTDHELWSFLQDQGHLKKMCIHYMSMRNTWVNIFSKRRVSFVNMPNVPLVQYFMEFWSWWGKKANCQTRLCERMYRWLKVCALFKYHIYSIIDCRFNQ